MADLFGCERTALVWAWSVRFKYLNFITSVLPISQLLIFTQMNLKVRLVFNNCNDLPLKFEVLPLELCFSFAFGWIFMNLGVLQRRSGSSRFKHLCFI